MASKKEQIRALRDSLNLDFQQLVQEDMKQNLSRYPQNGGLILPDRSLRYTQ